jgi:hypothetical protein
MRADVREDMWTLLFVRFRSAVIDKHADDDDWWVKLIPRLIRSSELRLAMDDFSNVAFLYRLVSSIVKEGPYPSRFGALPYAVTTLEHDMLSIVTKRFLGGVTRGRWYYEVVIDHDPRAFGRRPSVWLGWCTEHAFAQTLIQDTFVGGVAGTFSYDGTNSAMWMHGHSSPCADPETDIWQQGDTIGVGIDVTYGFACWFVNGRCVGVSMFEDAGQSLSMASLASSVKSWFSSQGGRASIGEEDLLAGQSPQPNPKAGKVAYFPCISLHSKASVRIRFADCQFVPISYSPLEASAETHLVLQSPSGTAFLARPEQHSPSGNLANLFSFEDVLSVETMDLDTTQLVSLHTKLPYWPRESLQSSFYTLTLLIRENHVPLRTLLRVIEAMNCAFEWEYNRVEAHAVPNMYDTILKVVRVVFHPSIPDTFGDEYTSILIGETVMATIRLVQMLVFEPLDDMFTECIISTAADLWRAFSSQKVDDGCFLIDKGRDHNLVTLLVPYVLTYHLRSNQGRCTERIVRALIGLIESWILGGRTAGLDSLVVAHISTLCDSLNLFVSIDSVTQFFDYLVGVACSAAQRNHTLLLLGVLPLLHVYIEKSSSPPRCQVVYAALIGSVLRLTPSHEADLAAVWVLKCTSALFRRTEEYDSILTTGVLNTLLCAATEDCSCLEEVRACVMILFNSADFRQLIWAVPSASKIVMDRYMEPYFFPLLSPFMHSRYVPVPPHVGSVWLRYGIKGLHDLLTRTGVDRTDLFQMYVTLAIAGNRSLSKSSSPVSFEGINTVVVLDGLVHCCQQRWSSDAYFRLRADTCVFFASFPDFDSLTAVLTASGRKEAHVTVLSQVFAELLTFSEGLSYLKSHVDLFMTLPAFRTLVPILLEFLEQKPSSDSIRVVVSMASYERPPNHRGLLHFAATQVHMYVQYLVQVMRQLPLKLINMRSDFTDFTKLCGRLLSLLNSMPLSISAYLSEIRSSSPSASINPEFSWLFALEPLSHASHDGTLSCEEDDIRWEELFRERVNLGALFRNDRIRMMVEEALHSGVHPSEHRENLRGVVRMWAKQNGRGSSAYQEALVTLSPLLSVSYLSSLAEPC